METSLLITGFAANLAAVLGVGVALWKRVEDGAYWRGKIETKLSSHEARIDKHGNRLDEHESWIQRHRGESGERR